MYGSGFDQEMHGAPHLEFEFPNGCPRDAHLKVDAAIDDEFGVLRIAEDVLDCSRQHPATGWDRAAKNYS